MRGWWLTSGLCLALAGSAGAQTPRWIMGKGNSFSRLEERLGVRGPLIARRRAEPRPGPALADSAPTRARAGLREFDSTLMPTAFNLRVTVPPGPAAALAGTASGR